MLYQKFSLCFIIFKKSRKISGWFSKFVLTSRFWIIFQTAFNYWLWSNILNLKFSKLGFFDHNDHWYTSNIVKLHSIQISVSKCHKSEALSYFCHTNSNRTLYLSKNGTFSNLIHEQNFSVMFINCLKLLFPR